MKKIITVLVLFGLLVGSVFAETGYLVFWNKQTIEKVEIEKGKNFYGQFFYEDSETKEIKDAYAWYWHNSKMVWDELAHNCSLKEAILETAEKVKKHNPDWDLDGFIETIKNMEIE